MADFSQINTITALQQLNVQKQLHSAHLKNHNREAKTSLHHPGNNIPHGLQRTITADHSKNGNFIDKSLWETERVLDNIRLEKKLAKLDLENMIFEYDKNKDISFMSDATEIKLLKESGEFGRKNIITNNKHGQEKKRNIKKKLRFSDDVKTILDGKGSIKNNNQKKQTARVVGKSLDVNVTQNKKTSTKNADRPLPRINDNSKKSNDPSLGKHSQPNNLTRQSSSTKIVYPKPVTRSKSLRDITFDDGKTNYYSMVSNASSSNTTLDEIAQLKRDSLENEAKDASKSERLMKLYDVPKKNILDSDIESLGLESSFEYDLDFPGKEGQQYPLGKIEELEPLRMEKVAFSDGVKLNTNAVMESQSSPFSNQSPNLAELTDNDLSVMPTHFSSANNMTSTPAKLYSIDSSTPLIRKVSFANIEKEQTNSPEINTTHRAKEIQNPIFIEAKGRIEKIENQISDNIDMDEEEQRKVENHQTSELPADTKSGNDFIDNGDSSDTILGDEDREQLEYEKLRLLYDLKVLEREREDFENAKKEFSIELAKLKSEKQKVQKMRQEVENEKIKLKNDKQNLEMEIMKQKRLTSQPQTLDELIDTNRANQTLFHSALDQSIVDNSKLRSQIFDTFASSDHPNQLEIKGYISSLENCLNNLIKERYLKDFEMSKLKARISGLKFVSGYLEHTVREVYVDCLLQLMKYSRDSNTKSDNKLNRLIDISGIDELTQSEISKIFDSHTGHGKQRQTAPIHNPSTSYFNNLSIHLDAKLSNVLTFNNRNFHSSAMSPRKKLIVLVKFVMVVNKFKRLMKQNRKKEKKLYRILERKSVPIMN